MTARRRSGRGWLAGILLLAIALFVALGVWQVQRRAWKHALIAAVEGRVHAHASPAPTLAQWPHVTEASDEYRHIRLAGIYLPGRDSFVRAVTDYGAGYWVMTPLRLPDGAIVMVNRGFVPPDRRAAVRLSTARPVAIAGLLRISEPGGGFLRRNDPASDAWYSRDVGVIAKRRGLAGPIAPWFLDLEAPPRQPAGRYPIPGLTVVRFPDNHAAYALTWFAMAALCLWALWRLVWRANNGKEAAQE